MLVKSFEEPAYLLPPRLFDPPLPSFEFNGLILLLFGIWADFGRDPAGFNHSHAENAFLLQLCGSKSVRDR